ncbi:uncharacterized protein LOC113004719 [Solenopsis invicta]|uniref:uncharacterized protein LOC113004719 n=1 Tax=Solenopsis invicta TaxID=13686 RepID=UPI000E33DAD4|nr:uncharacterized protein LOC113004719 [Solenopsis invicta]
MSACAVKGCNNSYRKRIIIEEKPVKYFRFPKDNAIAVKWREVCKNGVNMTYGKISSKHFDASCYDEPAQHIALNYSPLRGRKLRLDAIPTLHLFSELHMVKRLDTCAEDAHKTISDYITEAIPSTITLKIISESIAETEPSSTAKSQPATLDSIAGDAITTVTTADYSTLVKNLQVELAKTKEALMQSEKKKEKQIKEKVQENMYRLLKHVFTPGQI